MDVIFIGILTMAMQYVTIGNSIQDWVGCALASVFLFYVCKLIVLMIMLRSFIIAFSEVDFKLDMYAGLASTIIILLAFAIVAKKKGLV